MNAAPINVVLCDDSAIVRRILRTIIEGTDGMQVAGEGTNGAEGAELASQADVVVMDVEMPNCDGIEAVERIRQSGNKVPIIMFSSLTERGAEATLDAIAAGASDFTCKPSLTGSSTAAIHQVRKELITRIRAWGEVRRKPASAIRPLATAPRNAAPQSAAPGTAAPRTTHAVTAPIGKFECVTVGVSTGGPDALQRFVRCLPEELSVPIVVVQHMPATFTARLAEQLDRIGSIRVVEASNGMPLQSNTVYIAPGGEHLEIGGSPLSRELVTTNAPPIQSCRPSVDVLFQSAASVFGNRLLSVVMTGMGSDGLDGARAVKNAGGTVIVQDQASSVVWGMPGVVWDAGLATQQLPPEGLAQWVDRHCVRKQLAV